MSESLYLIETRARMDYTCSGCGNLVLKGGWHFRHDPFPAARIHRGLKVTHWCRDCILAVEPAPKDRITGRIRVPVVQVINHSRIIEPVQHPSTQMELPLFTPLRIELVGIGSFLTERLKANTSLIHQITPEQMEMLVCDRLYAMGFEPKRVGATNRKDGGIDVLFWPRIKPSFPFLCAAQVKHHRNLKDKVGSPSVREFAGTIAGHPIHAGLLVTNTSFSPDAEWFAREHAKLIRLRGFTDIKRWLLNNFDDEAEWREFPSSIELCPGVVVRIR